MLTKTYSIPAHTITEHAWTFDELDPDVRSAIAYRTADECIYDDMDAYADQLAYTFVHSTPELQWDASCSQGSGVNIYGTFSINDLLEFAGLDPISADDDFDIEFDANRWYTYSKWDHSYYMRDIEDAIERELLEKYLYDLETSDDPFVRNLYAFARDKFWLVWDKRIEQIVWCMDSYCSQIYRYMDDGRYEWYFEPDCYDDMLFDSDGTFKCYAHEW